MKHRYTIRWKEKGEQKSVQNFETNCEVFPCDILLVAETTKQGIEVKCLKVEVRVLRDSQTELLCFVTMDPEKQEEEPNEPT